MSLSPAHDSLPFPAIAFHLLSNKTEIHEVKVKRILKISKCPVKGEEGLMKNLQKHKVPQTGIKKEACTCLEKTSNEKIGCISLESNKRKPDRILVDTTYNSVVAMFF